MLTEVASALLCLMGPGILKAQDELLFFGGIWLACAAIWWIIAILICIWVYRDAESRGMSGILWLIVVILLGIIGLIVYLVVRKPKVMPPPPMPYGAPPPPPGYAPPPPPPGYAPPTPPPQQPMGTNCRYCGAQLPPGSTVCGRCGGRL